MGLQRYLKIAIYQIFALSSYEMGKIKTSNSFINLKLHLLRYGRVFVVYDRNVEAYLEKFASGKPSMAITADEAHKTIDTVLEICRWLMSQGADRKSVVLAVGGGVTSDMVGFAAAIYKRGIAYINIPTTLLAMVDAGIGGKTGVNIDGCKNQIGVFKQPEFTYIYPKFLSTLPERELLSGAAEMIKTFIIRDDGNYEKALKLFSQPFDIDAAEPLIETAAKVKADIVKKDEFETGRRRVLNLGHTYGHAVEWWQRTNGVADPYTHGEAVAIGMVRAAVRSEALGVAKPGLADKIRADLAFCGLPTEMPCSDEELEQAVRQDKKSEDGKIHFVLIRDIGNVTVKKI